MGMVLLDCFKYFIRQDYGNTLFGFGSSRLQYQIAFPLYHLNYGAFGHTCLQRYQIAGNISKALNIGKLNTGRV